MPKSDEPQPRVLVMAKTYHPVLGQDLRARCAFAARKRMEERFGIDLIISRYADLFRSLKCLETAA